MADLTKSMAPGRPTSRFRCMIVTILFKFGASFSVAAESKEAETFFESEIRPVLATRCVDCHGPDRQDGGIRLDSRSGVSASTASGVFARTIRGESTAPAACVMESRLADLFDQWIALGLPWPEATSVSSAADKAEIAKRHWAFQPVRIAPTPGGAANPIDAFVLDRLGRAGLSPSPEADRRTLIRRLSYTLTGLPPRIDEVNHFVNDPAPDAYAKLVDRLLESPHYGEHWARHWLDVARYSDTKGYVYAREEKNWPHAWVYRDWIVGALNEDLPYDQFLMLQLAADQIVDRRPGGEAAMGLLTIGRRFLGVEHDIIDDRIDVVTRGMLGLTVGCARCHDHKYDPIPAADYYSLHGIFDSSIEKLAMVEPGDEAFRKSHEERVRKLDEMMVKLRAEAEGRVRERLGDYLQAQTELGKYPADGFDQVYQKTDLLPAVVHAWRDTLRNAGERNDPVFAPWHTYAALPKEDFATAARAIDWSKRPAHARVAAAFSTPPTTFDEVISRYAEVLNETGADETIRAVTHGPGSPCVVPEGPLVNVETFFDTESINELWKLENEIARAIINAPETVRAALTLADRTLPTEPRIFLRGNPLNLGDAVPRQFLGILAGENRKPFSNGSGRLELAKAIVDPGNPLTARVIVNRVWAHHFGQGLVDTPSDFGTRAEPPSHPELLDWLTATFIEEGWSVKTLHRHILLSSTFRQSSFGPAAPVTRHRAYAADPGNRLLWRMNPHRLGYEEFRDAMMAASGDLDPTIGGKSVEAFKAPYARRRALYARVDRQFVPGALRVFDFANPDLHIPQRNETTVPQQALFFLNHPLVLDRARAVAKVAALESREPERVRALFRLALQRDPSDPEITESLLLVGTIGELTLPENPPTAEDWKYGYGAMDEKSQRVTGFTELPFFDGSAWQGGSQWPDAKLGWVQLTATGGHPGNNRKHAAVRRWTTPRAMTLSIRSKLVHEPKAGDGIRGFIVSSRVGLLGSVSIHAKSSELNVDRITVEPGETIDFLVDIGEGLNSDQFLWDISLTNTQTDRENPTPVWNAKSDFPVNLVTPLSAWEQLAQTILCSNEFLFVD